jgi:NADPH-dependent 2,4-dienoyl-CoA reductase/sulfur reductase-like enzyme
MTTIKSSVTKISLALLSRHDNHLLAATAKLAILFAATLPSRLSRYMVRLDRVGDIHFDKLLIATGTKPIRPTIPGSTLAGIFCLHTLADAEALRQAAKNARRVVVLGGGYLGVETATSLARMGVHVVLIEEKDLLLPQPAAPELSAFFSRFCAERGIELRLNDRWIATGALAE